ncbi:hypothetical protein AUK22_08265 [bacterium CG2_30_54_10]|nr:MAG: hypothetical protein AUK22_08265 [bacterium CG2_30_54_10]
MNADIRESIVRCLDRILAIYLFLTSADRTFIEGTPTSERLLPLLDQREVSFAELGELQNDLVEALREAFSQKKMNSLPEALLLLEREIPDMQGTLRDIRLSLKSLVGADRDVQNILEKSKGAIETEIKKLRLGANLLKGYLQPDETGSCFIDKVK